MRQRSGLARTIQEGSLYLLLLLLPFSKAAVEILFPFLFVSWLVERLSPRTRTDTIWIRPDVRWLIVFLGGYLVVCALSITVSTAPYLSLRGFIGKWLEYLLFFVVCADVGSRPGVATRSAAVLAISSVFVVIEAVTQELHGKGLFLGHEFIMYGRATGPYENPIDLATYFMVVLPILLGYSASRRWPSRILLWGLSLVLIIMFARTDALGAWLALCVGVVAVMSREALFRRYGLLIFVVVLLAAWLCPQSPGYIKEAFSLSRNGIADRWTMWQAAIGMIRDRPILGQGLNTFMDNYLRYRVGGEIWPRYAHNCYLQVAAETGILGAVAFLALLGLLFVRLLSGSHRGQPADRVLLAGLAVGLLAFALQAGIDTNFYALRQAALFWILAGLAVGVSARARTASRVS